MLSILVVLIRIFSLLNISTSSTLYLIEFCLFEIGIILIYTGIYYESNTLRELILKKFNEIENCKSTKYSMTDWFKHA